MTSSTHPGPSSVMSGSTATETTPYPLAYYDGSSTSTSHGQHGRLFDGLLTASRRAPCPSRGHELYRNPWSGQMQPKMCGAIRCPVCIVSVALRYSAAIALAEPEHFVLLTDVGEAWPTIKVRLNRYRQALRKAGQLVQDAYHVEPNPNGTGHHVHQWAWGGQVDGSSVACAASSAGLGSFTSIKTAYTPSSGRLSYGLKTIIQGGPECGEMPAMAQRYLEVNGGRLVHATRGFWRDGASGGRLAGVRAAAVVASQRHHDRLRTRTQAAA